jgi:hypothetical protein
MAIAAILSLSLSSCDRAPHPSTSPASAPKTQPNMSTSAAQQPDAIAAEVISSNHEFAQCRVRTLVFQFKKNCTWNPPQCDNLSRADQESLEDLRSAGYAAIDEVDGNHGVVFWTLTDKGKKAIGQDIHAERITGDDPDAPLLTDPSEATEQLTLILACRHLDQIDATTQLRDGFKVDFSWRWSITPLGQADGLSEERQRAVAYLTQTRIDGKMNLDQIQFTTGQ